MMRKKGLTLIELIVAMTIFVTVMTLCIGGFVAISKARALIGSMKETQQKVRVANEMIIRYAKQAEQIVAVNNKTIELYFDVTGAETAKKFAVSSEPENDLLYYECNHFTAKVCDNWQPAEGNSLLGGKTKGIYLYNTDVFAVSPNAPSVLNITLNIRNEVPGYASVSNDMSVQNAVILEGLK